MFKFKAYGLLLFLTYPQKKRDIIIKINLKFKKLILLKKSERLLKSSQVAYLLFYSITEKSIFFFITTTKKEPTLTLFDRRGELRFYEGR